MMTWIGWCMLTLKEEFKEGEQKGRAKGREGKGRGGGERGEREIAKQKCS